MTKLLLLLLLAIPLFAQTTTSVDYRSQVKNKPILTGSVLPSSCVVTGDLFYLNPPGTIYACNGGVYVIQATTASSLPCANSVADQAAFTAAVASLNAAGGGTLLLTGNRCLITANTTVPNNILLMPQASSGLSINSGVTVTLALDPMIGGYQVFFGAGSVVITNSITILAQWFGAKCNALNDDTTAIQSAINSAILKGNAVKLPLGTCNITAQLNDNQMRGDGNDVYRQIADISGVSQTGTTISYVGTSTVNYALSVVGNRVHIHDMTVIANANATLGALQANIDNGTADHLSLDSKNSTTGACIVIDGNTSSTYDRLDCESNTARYCMYVTDTTTTTSINNTKCGVNGTTGTVLKIDAGANSFQGQGSNAYFFNNQFSGHTCLEEDNQSNIEAVFGLCEVATGVAWNFNSGYNVLRDMLLDSVAGSSSIVINNDVNIFDNVGFAYVPVTVNGSSGTIRHGSVFRDSNLVSITDNSKTSIYENVSNGFGGENVNVPPGAQNEVTAPTWYQYPFAYRGAFGGGANRGDYVYKWMGLWANQTAGTATIPISGITFTPGKAWRLKLTGELHQYGGEMAVGAFKYNWSANEYFLSDINPTIKVGGFASWTFDVNATTGILEVTLPQNGGLSGEIWFTPDSYQPAGSFIPDVGVVHENAVQMQALVFGTSFTTATIPACTNGVGNGVPFRTGMLVQVSDGLTPAYMGTYSGGGAVITLVLCDGLNWKYH